MSKYRGMFLTLEPKMGTDIFIAVISWPKFVNVTAASDRTWPWPGHGHSPGGKPGTTSPGVPCNFIGSKIKLYCDWCSASRLISPTEDSVRITLSLRPAVLGPNDAKQLHFFRRVLGTASAGPSRNSCHRGVDGSLLIMAASSHGIPPSSPGIPSPSGSFQWKHL